MWWNALPPMIIICAAMNVPQLVERPILYLQNGKVGASDLEVSANFLILCLKQVLPDL